MVLSVGLGSYWIKCKLGFGRLGLQLSPFLEESLQFQPHTDCLWDLLLQEQLCYSLLSLYEFVQNGSGITQASPHRTGGKIYKVCPHQVRKAWSQQ